MSRKAAQPSIARRLALASLATSGTALLLAVCAMATLDFLAQRQAAVRDATALADLAGRASTAAVLRRDDQAANAALTALSAEPRCLAAALYARDGRLVAGYVRSGAGLLPTLPQPAATAGPRFVHDGLLVQRTLEAPGQGPVGTVVMLSEVAPLGRQLVLRILLGLAASLAAGLLALLLTWRLHAAVARPIRHLAETAQYVSQARDFSVRAVKQGKGELGVLVDGFNDMLTQVGESERRLREAHLELEKRVEERTQELQQEIAARQRVEQTIRQLAYFDALTGLPNRVLFNDRLSQALTYAERNGEIVAVMLLDLDRFKTINDTLGHAMGDRVLKAVAQRLRGCLRAEDTVARIGGDEFPVLLPGVRAAQDALKVAEKIVETLRPPFELEGHRLYATASVGLALYPVHGQDGPTLIKNADTALYRAKDHGRDNCQIYTTGTGDRAFERLVLENSLRRALELNEFVIHYQPVIEPASGAIVTVEALLRWMHPELGILLPSAFVGLAEETGLILPIGEWVLKTGCDQVRAWQQAGLAARLSVNLSARHFRQRDLVERIERVLAGAGLAPSDLTIEVKESVILEDADGTIELLQALRDLGLGLAVDDFGTGYSSLSHLRRLPANTLKIDQAFIQDIPADPSSVAIAHLIITMAHSLGLQVVAEGVESEAQFDFLIPAGCDFLQGNLFCRAVPPQEMTLLLKQGRLPHPNHAIS